MRVLFVPTPLGPREGVVAMEFRPMEASAVRVAAHGFAYRRTGGGRGQRVLLWIATAISIALWALPHVIR